jgi:tRNA-(ms[2]io[6]A)-hydroxylase
MLCLKVPTDPGWAAEAMRDAGAVLADHAHCELKAASNALSLAVRCGGDAETMRTLTDLAREEVEHFQRVLGHLEARGCRLGPPPVDEYAAELRRAAGEVPRAPWAPPLLDRLLVGALIEARSCERFQLLAAATAPGQGDAASPELYALWSELLASEARHYRTFVDLAVRACGGDRARVVARLDELAVVEGAIVARLARREAGESRATIHG